MGPNFDLKFDPNLFPNSTLRSWQVIWRAKLGHRVGSKSWLRHQFGSQLENRVGTETQLRASNFAKLGSKLEHKLCYRETPYWLINIRPPAITNFDLIRFAATLSPTVYRARRVSRVFWIRAMSFAQSTGTQDAKDFIGQGNQLEFV